MNVRGARAGDVGIMTSPTLDLAPDDLGCLEFSIYLTSAYLEIFYSAFPGSIWEKYICSVMDLQPNTWNRVQVNLTDIAQPLETVGTTRNGHTLTTNHTTPDDIDLVRHFLFHATILDASVARVWIDNVTVYSADCQVYQGESEFIVCLGKVCSLYMTVI